MRRGKICETLREDKGHEINICDVIHFNFYNNGLNQPGYSTESIKPIVTLNAPTRTNTDISSDEYLTINLPDKIDNRYYNWEYSVGNTNNFVKFPSQFNQTPILHIRGKDFLTENDAGKNIFIRVNMGDCADPSNIIAFTYKISAPHIISSLINPPKCFDTDDGSITLNFDRTLLPAETLELSLIDNETGSSVANVDITNHLKTNAAYTINNLRPGNYTAKLTGTCNGNNTYTDAANHSVYFSVDAPSAVNFSIASQVNVFCFQGSDGQINLTASGGQNSYEYLVSKEGQPFLDWTSFTGANSTQIQNLTAGVYKIKVRDINQCVAKQGAAEKELSITITQPSQAISLPANEIETEGPSGYGLSNGYISVRVIGGSSNSDGSYNYEWRKNDPNGPIITAGITTDASNNPFTIKLEGITAGDYYLTVKDKNYANAKSQLDNCGIISKKFTLTQPDLLIATIIVEKEISCNIANKYPYKIDKDKNGVPDEAEDGNLRAKATGGTNGYAYQWQMLNNGTFQNISGATNAELGHRTEGTYKILIKDSKNNEAETTYSFQYPAELTAKLFANTIYCNNQNSGEVSVKVAGGIGKYAYEWNTMDITPNITSLPAGNYYVVVTDGKGCKIKGNTEVVQPDKIDITDVLVQNPICYGANNGEIRINVSGGKAPYSINWSNGANGLNNLALVAGNYTLYITDANGCTVSKQYNLTNPIQFTVNLGSEVTLCAGDSKSFNSAINDQGATYQWKDQNDKVISTDAKVVLSTAGVYIVLVTSSKGCTATGSIVIKNSFEVLNPRFMLTTHAYVEENVVLINTSPVKPQAVEWIIPSNVQVINKTDELLELKFPSEGSYEIGLKGMQGLCEKTFYKTVVIENNISGISNKAVKAFNILTFSIVPNPNNGAFKAIVKLDKKAPIKLKVLNINSLQMRAVITQPQQTYFEVPMDLRLPSGVYLLILETNNEALAKKIVVQ